MLAHHGFWFLRHGETDWNTQSLAQGQVEIALNQRGMNQARAAGLALKGQGVNSIFTSPLLRARVTAEIVGDLLGLPVSVDDGLKEVSFGDHEGQPMGAWFDEWVEERFTPGGGESFSALRLRAVAAANRCLQAPGPVLLVAHGAFMRALRAAMGTERNVRTANAIPVHCTPPEADADSWMLHSLTP